MINKAIYDFCKCLNACVLVDGGHVSIRELVSGIISSRVGD